MFTFSLPQSDLVFGEAGGFGPHSHAEMVLDEVIHHQIVAELGKIHGCVLVLGQDVAVSSVLQQEAHYVCVPSFARLPGRTDNIYQGKLCAMCRK